MPLALNYKIESKRATKISYKIAYSCWADASENKYEKQHDFFYLVGIHHVNSGQKSRV